MSKPNKSVQVEWKQGKRWNPFNSYKLLAHVDRWKHIKRDRKIPPPILVTVDPTNLCNLDCEWCNAEYIRGRSKGSMSRDALMALADFLPSWGKADFSEKYAVEAVCIAGGGEPLVNPATPDFIDRTVGQGIEVGLVTNGILMNRCMDALSQCTWVGVSVDACTEDTFNKLKKPSEKNNFSQIIDNMSRLVEYSRRHKARLGFQHPAYGVSYKYLIHPDNVHEVFEATKLAKEIGCKSIHFRPAGTTWDNIGTDKEIKFSKDHIDVFNDQIHKSLALDCDGFGVYGVTHKFNSQFGISNCFSSCHAVFMTAVVMPDQTAKGASDSFSLSLCCDRRGDKALELASSITDCRLIEKLWGSEAHWRIHDDIEVSKQCPRCTYQPHNEIYEQVILNDSMTYKFI